MEILLNKHELLDLGENLADCRIVCLAGCCWLTLSGDSRDYILRSGSSFTVSMNGQLVVTATENSRLMLVAKPQGVKNSPWQPLICNP